MVGAQGRAAIRTLMIVMHVSVTVEGAGLQRQVPGHT